MLERCEGCKWWSARIAEGTDSGHVAAMCLCADSPRYGKMTVLRYPCKSYIAGVAIDDPATEGASTR